MRNSIFAVALAAVIGLIVATQSAEAGQRRGNMGPAVAAAMIGMMGAVMASHPQRRRDYRRGHRRDYGHRGGRRGGYGNYGGGRGYRGGGYSRPQPWHRRCYSNGVCVCMSGPCP